MTKIFSKRFLVETPPDVPLHFTDDPPPLQTRRLPEIRDSLIHDLLAKTTNTSAPGVSGHPWKIVKWVWEITPTRLADLVRACVHAGCHPGEWKEAIVSVIPKAGRADYTIAKNYRPISLLECLGKLVEKVVTRLMYQEIIKYDLVPTNQFGGRVASSTVDAALCLIHDVQSAHAAGLRTGICLFDIAGFFDHVNRPRLIQLIRDLGFAPEIVKWCKSFLADRTVRLKFNGILSDPLESDVGTPQGSPISPVLSVIFTAPLLHKVREWSNASLGMYVDDGVLFACGAEWSDVAVSLSNQYDACTDWLTRSGLAAEPEKTEVLFFRRQREQVNPPGVLHLRIPAEQTYYRVKASTNVRYLGFFIDHRTNWTRHVDIMCNRARATLKSLQLLGNSARGIDFAQWRLAYNGICLPVLTYGCQLWYKGKQVSLVRKLQTVQNEAVRIISGSFKTAPREPLHQLLSILPIDLRLDMLTKTYALRLYRLPRASQPLKRLQEPWTEKTDKDLPLPTPQRRSAKTALRWLASRVPARGPRIETYPLTPPNGPNWNDRLTRHPEGHQGTAVLPAGAVAIYCQGILTSKGSADGRAKGTVAASLYVGNILWGSVSVNLGETVTKFDAQLAAFRPALALTDDYLKSHQHGGPIYVLNGTKATVAKYADTRPGPDQPTQLDIAWYTDLLLRRHANICFRISWFKHDDAKEAYKTTKKLAFEAVKKPANADYEQVSINYQRQQAETDTISEWEKRWHTNPRTSLAYRTACTKPPDGRLHPILRIQQKGWKDKPSHTKNSGQLHKAEVSRSTTSTLFRFITGHAFTGEYTARFLGKKFHPLPEELVACPCGELPQTVEHVLLDCPIHEAARHKHLNARGRVRSLDQLFNNPLLCVGTLRFLEETQACAKPRSVDWDPG
jgi:hypothetical protein